MFFFSWRGKVRVGWVCVPPRASHLDQPWWSRRRMFLASRWVGQDRVDSGVSLVHMGSRRRAAGRTRMLKLVLRNCTCWARCVPVSSVRGTRSILWGLTVNQALAMSCSRLPQYRDRSRVLAAVGARPRHSAEAAARSGDDSSDTSARRRECLQRSACHPE